MSQLLNYVFTNYSNMMIYFCIFSLSQCVKSMLAFAIYITHALACYVAIDITWNDYVMQKIQPNRLKLFWEYVTRTGLVLVTCKYYTKKN